MAKIYISYSKLDNDLALQFSEKLREAGHEVLIDRELLQPGIEWRELLTGSLKLADIILVLMTANSSGSQFVLSEIGAARAYVNSFPGEKLLIPVIFDDLEIPLVIQDIQCVMGDRNKIQEVVTLIIQAITSHLGRKAAVEQKREERKAKIEQTASDYIDQAMQYLQKREKELSDQAQLWNLIGWGSLVGGVVVAAFFMIMSLVDPSRFAANEWPKIAFLGIKSVIIVALLVASAKYAFSLAKSYMCESLKNSDRIHAISFGKFYLQAFGESVDANDVKEVFQNWNISGTSAFSSLETSQFDPKIIEAIVSVADVIRKNESKTKKT